MNVQNWIEIFKLSFFFRKLQKAVLFLVFLKCQKMTLAIIRRYEMFELKRNNFQKRMINKHFCFEKHRNRSHDKSIKQPITNNSVLHIGS